MTKKLKKVIHEQLTQGATPKGLALTCAAGISIGCFPLLGLTTTLCLILGVVFRLNQPLLQVVNYLMYPVQILLIPFFLRLGEAIFFAEPMTFNIQQLAGEFVADPLLFFSKYGLAGLHAVVAWCLIAPVIAFIVFKIGLPIFHKIHLQRGKNP
jgi:uncharacterized protein (DUF2062 family)